MAEIVPHIELGDVTDGAGQLHPGRASADDDEIEHGMGAGLHHLPLRQLKGQQHAAPDFGRILDGLQAWCVLRPVIVAEVGVGRASAQDQVVIGDLRARVQQQARGYRLRCLPPRPSILRYSAFSTRWSEWAGRYRPGKGPPARPDRATAGKYWWLRRSMRVTSTAISASAFPALKPAKPPPTTTTRGRGGRFLTEGGVAISAIQTRSTTCVDEMLWS